MLKILAVPYCDINKHFFSSEGKGWGDGIALNGFNSLFTVIIFPRFPQRFSFDHNSSKMIYMSYFHNLPLKVNVFCHHKAIGVWCFRLQIYKYLASYWELRIININRAVVLEIIFISFSSNQWKIHLSSVTVLTT